MVSTFNPDTCKGPCHLQLFLATLTSTGNMHVEAASSQSSVDWDYTGRGRCASVCDATDTTWPHGEVPLLLEMAGRLSADAASCSTTVSLQMAMVRPDTAHGVLCIS